jgi:hypothetical protein
MNELDLANEPVQFEVAGMKLGFKRIGSIREMAIRQAYYVEQAAERARIVSGAFDGADRQAHVASTIAAIPDGENLTRAVLYQNPEEQDEAKLVRARMPAEAICRVLSEACGMERAKFALLMDSATVEEIGPIMAWVMGGKKNSA